MNRARLNAWAWSGHWKNSLAAQGSPSRSDRRRRRSCAFSLEALEDRQLLTASLPAISDITVPAQLGYQVPLDGSANAAHGQSYAVSSDNPDIQAAIATGKYWTLIVTHTSSGAGDPAFTGSITFQLFDDLAPDVAAKIEQFTGAGNYTNKSVYRVASNTPNAGESLLQGGPNGSVAAPSFTPQFPQQLAFTGTYQLALAYGSPDAQPTEFIVTTGQASKAFDFKYAIFGQLVAGADILAKMAQVSTKMGTGAFALEQSAPINPVTITSANLTDTNPNGVVHIDTTQAKPGETAHITVTATDSVDHSQISKTFTVTTTSYDGPNIPTINLKPFANSVSVTTNENAGVGVSLLGQNGYPAPNSSTLSYSIVNGAGPSHGTITGLNPATGTLTYVPAPGYSGSDSFQYVVTATGPYPAPPSQSKVATVSVTVAPVSTPPVVTPPHLVSASVVFTQKLNKKHKPVGPKVFSGFAFQFDKAMNPTAAGNSGNYQVAVKVQKRQGRKRVTVLQPISFTASFDVASNKVTLKPTGKQTFPLGGQLTLLAAGLVSSDGASLDGNNSGVADTDAVYNISKGGKSLSHA